MKDEIKARLQHLILKHGATTSAPQKQADEKAEREGAFAAAFRQARDRVIRPAMEEFGAELRVNGHDVAIRHTDEARNDAGVRAGRDEITLTLYPKGRQRSEFASDVPHVAFIADRSTQRVTVFASSMGAGFGGQSGPVDEIKLADLTAEQVEEHILVFLATVLGG